MQRRRVRERQLDLRKRLWPELDESELWMRRNRAGQYKAGFTTIPKTIPLILDIMDDLADGKPVSKAYLELWCRAFDECFVTLSNRGELAFHSGFSGQRAERAWVSRMRLLQKLGFIDIKPGPSGELSYALIWNPYHVIKKHHEAKTPGLTEAKFNALIARANEIRADDLDEPVAEATKNVDSPKTQSDPSHRGRTPISRRVIGLHSTR